MPEDRANIVVSKNGPYLVSGGVPVGVRVIVPNREGLSWDWQEGRTFETPPTYALCRCGQSNNKPFCDGSHQKVGFDGTETASREPYDRQAEKFEGPTMELRDQESLCAFARFCDPGGKIWALIERTDDPEVGELVIREATHCPSGRLVLHDRKDGHTVEEKIPKSIGVIEDPALEVSGPLWIRGGIPVRSADGKSYEVRNRMTLCRCGASNNKPFCDGSHASIKFKDGIKA
jgi:CDGSH-type Zn-finger protein